MNSHNVDKVVRDESVVVNAGDDRPKVLQADLEAENDLTIDEEFDLGGDPYNSTGRHAIITRKEHLED